VSGRVADAVLLTVLVALAWAIGAGLRPLDDAVNDAMFVETVDGVGVPVVIVRVDEATDAAFTDPVLFWDPLWAEVVDAAVAGGAERIALDVLLYALPGDVVPELGYPLMSAMGRARGAGLEVVNIAFGAGDGSSDVVAVKGPHRFLQAGSSAIGLANLTKDADGVVRRMELGCGEPYALARVLAGASGGDACATTYIRYREVIGGWPGASMVEVLERARAGDTAWLKQQFEGQTVLVGMTAPRFEDLFRTPLGTLTPGVEIHAQALRTLLDGDAPKPLPTAFGLLVAVLLGLGSLFAGRRLGPWPAVGVSAGGAIVVAVAGIAAGMALGYRIPFVAWGLAILLPGIAAAMAKAGQERAARQRLARTLGSYVNPHVRV